MFKLVVFYEMQRMLYFKLGIDSFNYYVAKLVVIILKRRIILIGSLRGIISMMWWI